MAETPKRPPIRIQFNFNVDTGDMEFIVDDNSPDRTEDYHDRVAQTIGQFLARNPQIADAGHIRYRLDREWHEITRTEQQKQDENQTDMLTD